MDVMTTSEQVTKRQADVPGADPPDADVPNGARPDAVRLAEVRAARLSVDEVLAAVGGPGVGGTAVFVGTVRDMAEGQQVSGLHYEAHPGAADALRAVLAQVAAAHPGTVLAATHRTGSLSVGEVAVVTAAGSAHRAQAFAACRDLIDTIKQQVPIWKRERFTSGEQTWVMPPENGS
jgi:molybdopterin synthase catalytic subunit